MKVRLKKIFYTNVSSGPTIVFSKEVNFPGTMFPVAGMCVEEGDVIDKIIKVTIFTVEGMIEAYLTPDKRIVEYGWDEKKQITYMKKKRQYYEKEGWIEKQAIIDFATRKKAIEETLSEK